MNASRNRYLTWRIPDRFVVNYIEALISMGALNHSIHFPQIGWF